MWHAVVYKMLPLMWLLAGNICDILQMSRRAAEQSSSAHFTINTYTITSPLRLCVCVCTCFVQLSLCLFALLLFRFHGFFSRGGKRMPLCVRFNCDCVCLRVRVSISRWAVMQTKSGWFVALRFYVQIGNSSRQKSAKVKEIILEFTCIFAVQ